MQGDSPLQGGDEGKRRENGLTTVMVGGGGNVAMIKAPILSSFSYCCATLCRMNAMHLHHSEIHEPGGAEQHNHVHT